MSVYSRPEAELLGSEYKFRASALGCPRSLAATLMGYSKLPPPAAVQKAWAAGHEHEAIVKARMRAWGINVYNEGKRLTLRIGNGDTTAAIEGHVDGYVEADAEHGWEAVKEYWDGSPAVLEIKSMSASEFAEWERLGWDGFVRYGRQVSVYMLASGLPLLFVVQNKESMALSVRYLTVPVYGQGEIVGLIRRVLDCVKENEGEKGSGYPQPKWIACEPQRFACGHRYLHDEEEVAEERGELEAAAKRYREIGDRIAGLEREKRELEDERGYWKDKLVAGIGDKKKVRAGSYVVSRIVQKRIDEKKLRENWQDAWEDCRREISYIQVKPAETDEAIGRTAMPELPQTGNNGRDHNAA